MIFAPFFAWIWVALGARQLNPSAPIKFGLGLVLLGVGFLVMVFAARLVVATGSDVAPTWLLLAYLIHTFGELAYRRSVSRTSRSSPHRASSVR